MRTSKAQYVQVVLKEWEVRLPHAMLKVASLDRDTHRMPYPPLGKLESEHGIEKWLNTP